MEIATLCLVVDQKKNRILLALKKRGFGANLWNCAGGKLEKDETAKQAAIRETEEEIGIKVEEIHQVGSIVFHDPNNTKWEVELFWADKWSGEPIETEEMLPKWFDFDKIPYNQMWPDDKIWLPELLKGKMVSGDVVLESINKIKSHSLKFDLD